MIEIELTDAPHSEDVKAIERLLTSLNEARTGVKRNTRQLAIFLREPESREVVGGLWGMSYFDMLFVDLLFIPESLRGTGMGTELLRRAEEEAVRRGCHGIWLDTFSWQARGFYERLGYRVFGTLEDHPMGHQRYFLQKGLRDI